VATSKHKQAMETAFWTNGSGIAALAADSDCVSDSVPILKRVLKTTINHQ